MSKKSRGDGDYDVGYGKPPVKSRFKKGQSGNPAGRRKKSEGSSLPPGLNALEVAILRAAELPADRASGDQGRSETGIEALVSGMLYSALEGDMRAAKMFKESYAAADAERRRLTPKDKDNALSVQMVRDFTEFLLSRPKSKSDADDASVADEIVPPQDKNGVELEATVAAEDADNRLSQPAASPALGVSPGEFPELQFEPGELSMPEAKLAGEVEGPSERTPVMSGEASAPGRPVLQSPARRARRGEPLVQSAQPFSAGAWGAALKLSRGE